VPDLRISSQEKGYIPLAVMAGERDKSGIYKKEDLNAGSSFF